MTKRPIIVLLALLALAGTASAAPISQERAMDIATSFMASRSMRPSSLQMAFMAPQQGPTTSSDQAAYYVFNAKQGGYVIIAGDDLVPPVLGYSDSGTIDAHDVPPAMQDWLDGYAAQIEAISGGATAEVRTVTRVAIEPLLPVKWGQGLPYNILFPHISGSSNAHAYTGCVATAMAQIMAYYQYPPRPTATIPGYTSSSGKTYAVSMPSLSPVDFDWENIHETYYFNDSTSAAAAAVQTLMLYSSTSLQSNFAPTTTGSYTRYIPGRLINYFGYKNSCHYLYRKYFSTQSWEDTIYTELAAGRPVAYGGNKSSGGHAFVCDGYDGQGLFHINWGWNGKSNGYFLLNLLNPSDEGIGSAAGAYGYVMGQGIGVGLEPGEGGGTAAFTFDDLTINSTNTTRSAATSNFTVTVSGKFVNYTNVSSMFSQGWGLFRDGEMIENLFYRSTTSAVGNEGYITVSSRAVNFGANLTSGTYRILPIYTIYGADDWHPCIGSDVNYIEVTINGNYSCSIKGYGQAGNTTRYTVNSCTTQGTLNHGKPVVVTLNLTNSGTSTNDMVYMFIDGEFNAMGLANIGVGETGDLVYRFTPTTAGTRTLTFSLNENGTTTLHTQRVTIATMPAATLDVSYRILNITDEDNRIITANKYSIIADITNTGTTTYNEDFSARLYRINNDDTNVGTELLNQTQPLLLAPGETTSLQFDFDHDLTDGWKYFCYLYYYSAGQTVSQGTKWYHLNFTGGSTGGYRVVTSSTPADGGVIRLTGGVTGNKAQAGDTVTFAVQLNTGYTFNSVSVTAAGDTVPTRFDEVSGIYTFIMPESDVTISATFDLIPHYSVTVTGAPAAGGTCDVSTASAMAGDQVTVTASPNVGWRCGTVTVTDATGDTIFRSDSGENSLAFVMPASDASVNVAFERSSGSLFKMVNTRADITAGDTYVLASSTHGKVMKQWLDGDNTFQADDVTAWLDADKTIARVSDEACFFTMTEVSDTTISSNTRTAAYLTNGNGYLRTSNYNVLVENGIAAESRAWMYIGNANNCLIRFKDTSSGSNGNWIVRYDNSNDNFKVMNWTATGAETTRVWLYKLVEAYAIKTECTPADGGFITLTGGAIDDTAQAGETVSFTVTTAQDYNLGGVSVVTDEGDTIATTVTGDNAFTFVMPDRKVTISALFAGPPIPEPLLGDVNGDRIIDISDITQLISYVLTGYADPFIAICADMDHNGIYDIADITRLIALVLTGN